MGDMGAHGGVEHDAGEMGRRAGARRPVAHLVLVLLGVFDEFLEIVDRQVLAHDQHRRDFGNQRDRREIGRRVVERPLVERLVLGVGADRAELDRVAVRRRLGDAQAAGHAAGAADIFDDDLLAEHFAHALPDHAAEHVGRAAGGERDDHGDRTGGIGLGLGRCETAERPPQTPARPSIAATANFDMMSDMFPPAFARHLDLRPGRVKVRVLRRDECL